MSELNKLDHCLHVLHLEARTVFNFSPAVTEHMPIFCLFSDLMERSLGVNTFQLAKKLVDKVISVRYCISTCERCYSEIHLNSDYGLLFWAIISPFIQSLYLIDKATVTFCLSYPRPLQWGGLFGGDVAVSGVWTLHCGHWGSHGTGCHLGWTTTGTERQKVGHTC